MRGMNKKPEFPLIQELSNILGLFKKYDKARAGKPGDDFMAMLQGRDPSDDIKSDVEREIIGHNVYKWATGQPGVKKAFRLLLQKAKKQPVDKAPAEKTLVDLYDDQQRHFLLLQIFLDSLSGHLPNQTRKGKPWTLKKTIADLRRRDKARLKPARELLALLPKHEIGLATALRKYVQELETPNPIFHHRLDETYEQRVLCYMLFSHLDQVGFAPSPTAIYHLVSIPYSAIDLIEVKRYLAGYKKRRGTDNHRI